MTKKDRYIVEMRRLLDHWNMEACRCETLPPDQCDADASDGLGPQCVPGSARQPMTEAAWRSPEDAAPG